MVAVSPKRALVALRRLENWARRSGNRIDDDIAVLEHALGAANVADEEVVWGVARTLWSRTRGVDARGFNATNRECKEQWLGHAREVLRHLGFEMSAGMEGRGAGEGRTTARR